MGDITVLEEIGLKEVSRKTYIEVKYLQLMVNKDFAKLNRTNALGFVKIIKREYGISLDEWVREFDEYCEESGKGTQNEQIFPDTRPSIWQNSTYVFLVIVFIVLLGGLIYTFFYDNDKDIFPTNSSNLTNHIASPIIKEAVTNLENITNIAEEETENFSNIQNETQSDDEIQTDEIAKTDDTNDTTESTALLSEVAILKPTIRIWAGVIDLSTFKRRVYQQNKEIEIDLTKDQLIITGHGDFALVNTNGNDILFASKDPKYLYVKNGTITQITKAEFKSLNRDTAW